MNRAEHEQDDSRREFVHKIAYTVPLILSLKAQPAFAATGSAKGSEDDGDERRGRHEDDDEDGNEDGDSQGGKH